MSARRGRSSVVERQLPKLNVVGSIPIARSRTPGYRSRDQTLSSKTVAHGKRAARRPHGSFRFVAARRSRDQKIATSDRAAIGIGAGW